MSCNCNCDCTHDIEVLKGELLKNRIELTDTISQFMEKCNNNFHAIVEWGGGPVGAKGDNGDPGVPTKPKVPIHVWRIGDKFEYLKETPTDDGGFVIDEWNEDLSDVKYQEGHLIMLENAHVYILEAETDYKLKPKFILALQSYNAGDVVDGKNAYIHIAYANAPNSYDGFITDQQLRGDSYDTEDISTFSITRSVSDTEGNVSNMPYMGVYSDNNQKSSVNPNLYTWIRIQGNSGAIGEKGDKGDPGEKGEPGEKGDKGDSFTGHPYVIDLEGDMATISLDEDRTRLYDDSGDYCECTLHAYYGSKNVKVHPDEITIGFQDIPDGFKFLNDGKTIVKMSDNSKVGEIVKNVRGNDVVIKFIPDETFVFPKTTIVFKIHVETAILDEDDKNIYTFTRDTVWMVKGIVSDFELEILPQYRSIKLFEDGEYYPKKLSVTVYKIKDAERTVFNNINDGKSKFTLLYKNLDDTVWTVYPDYGVPNSGINTEGVSCLEFKIVKYSDTSESETPEEEIWDYEDVWVVSDGKGVHYYHADLGATESMMVLTTGETGENIGTEDSPIYCAELRNENGYSIYLNPKFFDGSEELEITEVNIAPNSGDEYYLNGEGPFQRYLETIECGDSDGSDSNAVNGKKYKFTITSVPYGVDMIPMYFDVRAKCPIYNEFGNLIEVDEKNDTVSFMVYISTLSNTYSLRPTPTTFNTSTGKDGATISCSVYKNNVLIPTREEWKANGLLLEYVVYDSNQMERSRIEYDEPIIYGDDSDSKEDEFNAEDVAIEFILSYKGTDIVRSTVPLVKDGIDGRDGDSWQYIFCRSPKYPFGDTGFSNPYGWTNDPEPENSEHEYFGENEENYTEGEWYDDHKGIDSVYRYEYQSYRKWDKINKCWGKYGEPTLYSNYSESGSGYSVLLSNPIAVIPVGDDWSTDEGLTNQYDSTLIYIYNKTTDISTNPNVSISLPANNEYVKKGIFKITTENNINKVTFTPRESNGSIFTFEPNTQYKLPITITYILGENSDSDMDNDGSIDNFSTTINWILSPIKGLEDIEVFVDKRVVNTSSSNELHTLNVGYYRTSQNSTKKFIETPDNIFDIILTHDIGSISEGTSVLESWQNVEYDFVHNGKNCDCYVVLVEHTSKSIIDYTVVTSVKDGIDGASAIHLELSQDYISLPSIVVNGEIYIDSDYDVNEYPIQSRMMLYNGDELISNNIEFYFKVNGESVDTEAFSVTPSKNSSGEYNGHSFDVPKDVINGDIYVECIAKYNGANFTKTLFIDLEDTPYELELNKDILLRDVNNGNKISTESISVRVKYWADGKWHYTPNGYVVATTTNGKENLHFDDPQGDKFERFLLIEGSPLESNVIDTEVRILYYYDADSDGDINTLSYETLGIVSNGKDGDIGISKFKSTVFIRSESEPDTPSGGSWDNPLPDAIDIISKWSDGIPDGNGPIWSSSRWFSTDPNFQSEWSKPVLMTDSADFEVIYSSEEDITDCDPRNVINFFRDTNGGIEGWLNESGLNETWFDDGGTDSIWMATINKVNGKWGNWTVSKIKGESGKDGTAPTCIATTILGYSLDENLDVEKEDGWKPSLDALGDINVGDKIYIRNQYTWKESGVEGYKYTYGKSVTLAGTQGAEGKSRVLFYRGSFESDELTGKKPTLSDNFEGMLTNVRCDYYIDALGNAWMRKGTAETSTGYAYPYYPHRDNDYKGQLTNETYPIFIDNWEQSTKVGFLQAEAITADMINTGSLVADNGFITELTSSKVIADTLQVKAANITGTLKIGSISDSDSDFDGVIIEEGAITANMINATNLKVDAANITGTLKVGSISDSDEDGVTIDGVISGTLIEPGSITTGHFQVGTINANIIESETITADQIKAGAITAGKIAADAISAFEIDATQIKTGKLDASRIDVDTLSVVKLDTQKTALGFLTSSQVRIQGNEILVTEDLSPKPVLQITGASISDDFAKSSEPVQKNITFENGGFSITNKLNTQLFSNNNEPIQIDLGVITDLIPNINNDIYTKTRLYVDNFANSNDPNLDISTKHSITCTISIDECSGLMFTPKANPNSQTNTSTSVPGFDIGQQDFITTTGNESVGSFSMGIRCIVYDKVGNIVATSKYKRTPSASIDFRDGKFYNGINSIGSLRTVSVPFDTMCLNRFCDKSKYTIKLALEISEILFYNIGKLTMSYEFVNPSVNFYAQSLIGNMPNVNIYKDTFRYFIDDYNYLNIDDEGYFTYYGPGKIDGFGVNKEDGVWFFVGGCYFKLSDLSSSMQNASKRYKDLNERYNTVEGTVAENGNTLYAVKNDLYGEGGTPTNSTPGSLVFSRNQIETDLYGEGGNGGLIKNAVTISETGDNSFTNLFNRNVSRSTTIVTTSGSGTNSFETLLRNNNVITTSNASDKLEDTFKNSAHIQSIESNVSNVASAAKAAQTSANSAITQLSSTVTIDEFPTLFTNNMHNKDVVTVNNAGTALKGVFPRVGEVTPTFFQDKWLSKVFNFNIGDMLTFIYFIESAKSPRALIVSYSTSGKINTFKVNSSGLTIYHNGALNDVGLYFKSIILTNKNNETYSLEPINNIFFVTKSDPDNSDISYEELYGYIGKSKEGSISTNIKVTDLSNGSSNIFKLNITITYTNVS